MPNVIASVVIPFYNAAPTLARCLDAMRAQSLPADAFEIIAVDNNSTDGSADIVKRYPEVVLRRAKAQGAYVARNVGVAAAKGRILVFTDPDCVPNSDWLETVVATLDSSTSHVLIGGYVPPAHSQPLRLLVLYENTKDAFVFGTDIPELYYGHTNNMAVRRSTFVRFGPFVERRRGADTIFVRHVVESLPCSAVRYCDQMLVEHLEVHNVLTYYRKMATYGQSRESYRHLSWTRPLTFGERITVLRRTRRAHHLSLAQSGQLLLMLSLGLLAWRSGRALAQLRRLMGASGEIDALSSGTVPALDPYKQIP